MVVRFCFFRDLVDFPACWVASAFTLADGSPNSRWCIKNPRTPHPHHPGMRLVARTADAAVAHYFAKAAAGLIIFPKPKLFVCTCVVFRLLLAASCYTVFRSLIRWCLVGGDCGGCGGGAGADSGAGCCWCSWCCWWC